MDRKSIIVVLVCLALLVVFNQLVNKLYPPRPLPPGATNSLAAIEAPAITNPPGTSSVTAAAVPAPSPAPKLLVNTNVPEQLLVLTNDNARYTFTSRGGGLKLIELVNYPETVATRRGKAPPANRMATLNPDALEPILAVLDGEAVQGDGVFNLAPTTNGVGVRAEKSLANGLTLVKEFVLGTNYLLTATVRMENHSTLALPLPPQEWAVGTATPMNAQDQDRARAVSVLWYDNAKAQTVNLPYFNTNTSSLFGFMPRTPKSEYRAGTNNVVWVSVQNQYFALVTMPQTPAPAVLVHMVDLPPPSQEELMTVPQTVAAPKGLETALQYPARTLAPGQTNEQTFVLFAGPKEYHTLAHLADRFNNNVDLVMGFGFFGFFSKGLLLGMNWLHGALNFSYGWAIIAITVFIKLLFWPLTQASTRSMKRMQALQPQMKAIAEKYKDDPIKKNQKTMEFMKENKVSPLGGCLPMLIQMPVLFGFFFMIRSAIELRGAPFLWVADLSKPDTLFIIPGFNFPFNLLPLLMTVTSVWQTHLTPSSPNMDPNQQKMMRYMPVMMVVIFYTMPAGLTLYYTVQSLLSVVQTKLTRTYPAAAPAAPVLTRPQKKRK
jgi:YidC/Oxa1 family membrane protein insertase